jgi:hypothetical protein
MGAPIVHRKTHIGHLVSLHRTGVQAQHPRTRRKPQVRTTPARTPAETLQPRRSFHALREGFSPHPLLFQASGRPNAPFSPCGRRGRGDEGANAHGNARAPGAHLRCARLRRVPPQRRSSPAGASTRSGRASARTLSRFAHQDAQTPPLPVWEKGVGGMRGQTRTRRRDARAPDPHAGGGSYCQSAPGAGIAFARAIMA